MEQIQVTAVFPSIANEDLAEFKRVASEVRGLIADEPGTLQHDWFFNKDESRCVVRETYADSDAVLAHLAHVGDLLGTIIRLGGGLEVDVFGEPSAELLTATEAMSPVVYAHFQSK